MPVPYSNPTLYPDALSDAETRDGFKWHRGASSPRSSQVFCLSAFGTLRKLAARDAVLEALFRNVVPDFPDPLQTRSWSLVPEAEDAALLSEHGTNQPTSIDMLCVAPDAVICIESKFATDAQHGFGTCSQFPKACAGFYGPGSDQAKGTGAWCRLENWEGRRAPRAYWSLARQYFRAEVFARQSEGDVCPLRGSNYQLMRNFLFAAAMAERERKVWFGVVAIGPEQFAAGLGAQVARFRDEVLHPSFAGRIGFVTYETYIGLLRNSGDSRTVGLGDFLQQRIAAVIGGAGANVAGDGEQAQ